MFSRTRLLILRGAFSLVGLKESNILIKAGESLSRASSVSLHFVKSRDRITKYLRNILCSSFSSSAMSRSLRA